MVGKQGVFCQSYLPPCSAHCSIFSSEGFLKDKLLKPSLISVFQLLMSLYFGFSCQSRRPWVLHDYFCAHHMSGALSAAELTRTDVRTHPPSTNPRAFPSQCVCLP